MDGASQAAREVKVVLLGDAGVGKSSLVLRFVTNSFDKYSESTIGASFMSKLLLVDGAPIKYQIWDTADRHKITLRTATFAVACERILTARQERGLYP